MTDHNANTEQVFFDNGSVWFISTSSWTGRDKLRPEDIGKSPEDILDIIELGSKKLLPDETRNKLTRPRGQVVALMERVGKHFLHFKGAYFVPNRNFLVAKEGIEAIIENQNVGVDDLIENFDEIKEEMIDLYPFLIDANWPTEKQIRRKFGIKYTVCEIKGASINEVDPEEVIEAKRRLRRELQESFDEYKEQVLAETKRAIIEACQEISQKIDEGAKITIASLNKPKRVIEDYLNIAEFLDLDGVRTEVHRLKAKLDETEAQDLRGDYEFAQNFAQTVRAMADNIGDLSGLSSDGTVKRVVRRKAA